MCVECIVCGCVGVVDKCSNIAPFAMNLHSLLPSDEDKETFVSNFAVLIAGIYWSNMCLHLRFVQMLFLNTLLMNIMLK